jgi:hypothetical protein
MTGLFRQSVFGRLGGDEDVNDANRLGRDPAMRWIVGGKSVQRQTASATQMGRFETVYLASDENFAALTELFGIWIDRVHDRRPPKIIILDMGSSVSPTHGEQEIAAYNRHFGCTFYHPVYLFNHFGNLKRCSLCPSNVHSADGWRNLLEPVVERYRERNLRRYFRRDAASAEPCAAPLRQLQLLDWKLGQKATRGGQDEGVLSREYCQQCRNSAICDPVAGSYRECRLGCFAPVDCSVQ